ncbi:MAG: redoxin domain-containing protein [Chloroflexi bacterium]|nr:redoxin domain-containing protein [Chloroflexota bacterium]MDA1002237.1 redoxin domain-containing protein [Chloroflexota bacterium]
MSTVTATLPAFGLDDQHGTWRTFPSGRPALLVFVHEECPTCGLSMPLIEAAHRAFGTALDIWAIGQDAEGNAALIERHDLTGPLLDDSELKVSFAYGFDTVPTVILAGGDGAEISRFVGFGRDDWRALFGELAARSGLPAPELDWAAYPDSRPGCGSRAVEPGIYERLVAESEGSPLRARRIEIAPDDDVAEFFYDQGLTDGLPVVPPTPERVLRMLGGTRRDSQEVVAVVPPNLAPATVEKIAINAVLAGCRPEYLPVVIAAVEAMCTDEFNIHGVSATTMGATPLIIVNGPIRHRIGMNMRLGALGAGNRANASIGRAVRLVLRNVGGGKPGGTERSTLGNSMKYTACFAEWEERSPWEPLHVERGFAPEDSVVTLFAATGQNLLVDQTSRTAKQLGGSFGLKLEAVYHPKGHPGGDVFVAVCPEHIDTLWRDGYTKEQLRERIQEITARPIRELLADDDSGAGIPAGRFSGDELDRPLPKFGSTANIHLVVAGADAGKFSMIFDGWASGPIGSIPTSRKIEEVS